MGMPHRGRLNLLCNLLHKPAGQLFGELLQAVSEFHIGDVQYHQGQASTLAFPRTVSLASSAIYCCRGQKLCIVCFELRDGPSSFEVQVTIRHC